MTYDPDHNRLLLFGGRNISGTMLADLWAFNLTAGSSAWTLLDEGRNGSDPPARMAHTLTYDEAAGQVVLAGASPPMVRCPWVMSGFITIQLGAKPIR